jgi:charged multivesicular body protein 1
MAHRSFQVKMQAKQLEAEAMRLQKEANKERTKARAELRRGNRQTAALYAQNAVRYDQQANQILQSCAAVTGMATDMRAAEVTAHTSKTMGVATAAMAASGARVDLATLSRNRTKMDGLKQHIGAAHDLITNAEGQEQVTAGADDLLAALEEENNQYAMMQIADIPEGLPGATANPAAHRFAD